MPPPPIPGLVLRLRRATVAGMHKPLRCPPLESHPHLLRGPGWEVRLEVALFFSGCLNPGSHSPVGPRGRVAGFLQSACILVWVASRSFRVAWQRGWGIPELEIRAGMSNFSGTLEDSDSQAPGVWLPYTNVRATCQG